MLSLHGIGWSRSIMPQYTKVSRCYDKYYSRSFQARGALMIALESSTCNTEFNGMIDSVWSGPAQEVSDSDRLWRELMSTNRTLVITLVTTKVHHVDCYFWYQTTTFGYMIDRVWPETAQEGQILT